MDPFQWEDKRWNMFYLPTQSGGKMSSIASGKISSAPTNKNRECRTCSEMIVNCGKSTKRISEEASTCSFYRFKFI
jgi:hypothetical protein